MRICWCSTGFSTCFRWSFSLVLHRSCCLLIVDYFTVLPQICKAAGDAVASDKLLPMYAKLLHDNDVQVRTAATKALDKVCPTAKSGLLQHIAPLLEGLAADTNEKVRGEAHAVHTTGLSLAVWFAQPNSCHAIAQWPCQQTSFPSARPSVPMPR